MKGRAMGNAAAKLERLLVRRARPRAVDRQTDRLLRRAYVFDLARRTEASPGADPASLRADAREWSQRVVRFVRRRAAGVAGGAW